MIQRHGVAVPAAATARSERKLPSAPGEAPTSRFTRRTETVREAFRLGRLAKTQRRLWQFYMEHNLHEEARVTRVLMLGFLRSASQQWRLTLAGNN